MKKYEHNSSWKYMITKLIKKQYKTGFFFLSDFLPQSLSLHLDFHLALCGLPMAHIFLYPETKEFNNYFFAKIIAKQ